MFIEVPMINLMLFILLSFPACAAPDEASGIVIELDDGVSFMIKMENLDPLIEYEFERIRLADVDLLVGNVPAIQAANEFAKSELLDQRVWLDIDDKSEDGRDPYGRLICVVYLEDSNHDINTTHPFNRMLIDRGHAVLNDFKNNEFDPYLWWPSSDEEERGISRSHQVVINEVELNPPGYDEDNEWTELYNKGQEDVDIGNWNLITAHGIHLTIPSGTTIPTKGFYVAFLPGYWLRNSDEALLLKDDRGQLVDQTPDFSDDINDDLSWSRHPDGGEIWVYIESSRGSSVPPIIYSEGQISAKHKKDWLTCCGGYSAIHPADMGLWDVSDFMK